MKHKVSIALVTFVLAFIVASPAMGQTLADRAREARKAKPSAPASSERVYTNESMNLRPAPAIADTKASAAKDSAKPTAASASDEAEESEAVSPEEEKRKIAADFKDKIEKAKAELTQLQRELDVVQRENRMRTAIYYADAGNKLRNERAYNEETKKVQADAADKQAKITALQSQLETLRNGARRAGLTPGQIP
jgi:hypothetical protein